MLRSSKTLILISQDRWYERQWQARGHVQMLHHHMLRHMRASNHWMPWRFKLGQENPDVGKSGAKILRTTATEGSASAVARLDDSEIEMDLSLTW